jgi:hypothetical protein
MARPRVSGAAEATRLFLLENRARDATRRVARLAGLVQDYVDQDREVPAVLEREFAAHYKVAEALELEYTALLEASK